VYSLVKIVYTCFVALFSKAAKATSVRSPAWRRRPSAHIFEYSDHAVLIRMGFFGRSPLLPVVTHDDGSQSDPLLVATAKEAVAAAAALQFPPGFIFGSATSAYQVEGGIVDTNWNRWEQQKTKRCGGETIRNGEEAGRACDMWNLFEDVDLPLIEELGLNSFRFSIEWSRVEPTEGAFDDAALARYERWCTLLRARGIEPCVTLLHFTEPGWFVDQGGWEEKRNVSLFVRFCERVVRRLSPFCSMWCTLNEPVGCATAWSKCPLGSAPSRLLRLLRARLAALTGPALPGERRVHWAPSHCLGCSS
jgi:hypothetical protein